MTGKLPTPFSLAFLVLLYLSPLFYFSLYQLGPEPRTVMLVN